MLKEATILPEECATQEVKSKNKKICFGIMFGLMFFIVCGLTTLSPLVADDYAYSFIFGTEERVAGLGDIITSMTTHYIYWGGRVLAHGIAQLFLWLPKALFNVANAAMYTLLVYVIYRFGNTSKNISLKLLLGILVALWLCIPVFGQVVFWLTGSCNYFWSVTVILAWVLQFKLQMDHPTQRSIGYGVAVTLLGFIAGAFSENTSAAGLLCAGLLMLYMLFLKIKWQAWMITSVVSGFLGWLFLILAPGNSARASLMETGESFFGKYYNRFMTATQMLEEYCFVIIILFAMLLSIAIYQKVSKKAIYLSLIFALTALASNYAMVLSPTYPARATMGVFAFFLVGCAVLFHSIQVEWFRILATVGLSAVLVAAIFDGMLAADVILQNNIMQNNRIESILEQKEAGILDVETVCIRAVNSKSVFHIDSEDLGAEVDYWANIPFAAYYGVDTVVATANSFYD